jgi:plasmid maintenance system killer protein
MELDGADSLHDLKGAGTSLEEFGGLYHIRISGMWRLSFVWENGNAYEVKITKHYR